VGWFCLLVSAFALLPSHVSIIGCNLFDRLHFVCNLFDRLRSVCNLFDRRHSLCNVFDMLRFVCHFRFFQVQRQQVEVAPPQCNLIDLWN